MTAPIKVLQIGMTRNLGGLETYLMQQFDHIDSMKVRYDFVNITGEYDIVFKDKILNSGSKIYSVCSRHKNPLKHYWQWLNLLNKIGKEYKAIVLNSNSLEYIFPLFAAKIFGIPIRIMHSHNSGYEHAIGVIRGMLVRFNNFLMTRTATDYWACSEQAGIWMFGNDTKFKCIHNAIDVEQFAFNSDRRNKIRNEMNVQDRFVIGHVGRFTYQKNHEFLIDVFNELVKIMPESLLMLCGDYVDDDAIWNNVHQKVEKYGLTDKVLFMGMRSDVPDLMQAMDCFVLPSRFEGLGIVGIEAQAAGLPCFFSNTITDETKITSLAEYISLSSSPRQWAEVIAKYKNSDRKDMTKDIANAGYDIRTEIRNIEQFYMVADNE